MTTTTGLNSIPDVEVLVHHMWDYLETSSQIALVQTCRLFYRQPKLRRLYTRLMGHAIVSKQVWDARVTFYDAFAEPRVSRVYSFGEWMSATYGDTNDIIFKETVVDEHISLFSFDPAFVSHETDALEPSEYLMMWGIEPIWLRTPQREHVSSSNMTPCRDTTPCHALTSCFQSRLTSYIMQYVFSACTLQDCTHMRQCFWGWNPEKELYVQNNVCYFEMTWMASPFTYTTSPHDMERGDAMSIGISHKLRYSADGMVGWLPLSIGYHSDDGYIYENGSAIVVDNEDDEEMTWGMGDTVGCGVDVIHHRIIFTKNGRIVFTKTLSERYTYAFPCIGFHTLDAMILNYGTMPFVWDVVSYAEAEGAREGFYMVVMNGGQN